ncbi:group II intron reverse transcriptase/maturase [Gemmata sp. JC673]|uniref:Group II intron reverse transcriptase/maturase n=1 Tax=Gemmata algarum TaxID=2975278 RepID=A0ABU5FAY9_9BACT|nr:group II intron reverse transcriptase/maturase [Gemmata algarum]MDY3563009.1 group II intron reverse transcriptase/maturase [Gemmata algarum]
MSLRTPVSTVEKLQTALQAKAKADAEYRFYTLWDKVCRSDVLAEAYRRCRANRGAPGVDGETFEQIESAGVGSWLASLQEELRRQEYRPRPLLRVWIPKSNGGQRPLGIPTIRDRVVQMAVLVVIGPIFEADLCDEQYGFRSGVDAKMAVRQVHANVSRRGLCEVVDADLSDYFNTIPHGPLMRCLCRRIADGSVLSAVRRWLRAPVVERRERAEHRTTVAADTNRGAPQGGVASPLLANLYFRRFVLAWKQFGHEPRLQARVVNYADDLVICCRPGSGPGAMAAFRNLVTRLGLSVNEQKTRLVMLPEESVDFLGYTIGPFHGKGGRVYIGTRPSKKSVAKLWARIREETSSHWNWQQPAERVEALNPILRGWCGYFNQGPVGKVYRSVRRYVERRLRGWLTRREPCRGPG